MLQLAKDKNFEDLKNFGFKRIKVIDEGFKISYYWERKNELCFCEETRLLGYVDEFGSGDELLFDLIIAGYIEKNSK